MSSYSIKMPDMSRNIALAGKTVSSRGMNVTYDEDGYAVSARNYGHSLYAGTDRSVRAPSIDTVLSAIDRASMGGSVYDQQHFSDRELLQAADFRQQVEKGLLEAEVADRYVSDVRASYGYTGGRSGNEYVAVDLVEWGEDGPERAFAAREPDTSVQAPVAVKETSVQASAALDEALKSSYLERLEHQQQRQSIQDELQELQNKDNRLRAMQLKNAAGDALMSILAEDEEKER